MGNINENRKLMVENMKKVRAQLSESAIKSSDVKVIENVNIKKGKTYKVTKEISVDDGDMDEVYLSPSEVIKITGIDHEGFVTFDLIQSKSWNKSELPIKGYRVWDHELSKAVK